MNVSRIRIITPNDLDDYRKRAGEITDASWPEFMLYNPIANESWHKLFDRFDWLRVHVKAEAKIIKLCHEAMLIHDIRAEWEELTNMKFPQSGQYIIPGALGPIEMSIQKDEGVYMEPNVWPQHLIS